MTADYQKALVLIKNAKENNAKELNLSQLTLGKIPDEIVELRYLNQLNLSKSKIQDYSNLKNLHSLTYLDIRYSQIKDFSFFKELRNLKILDIGCSVIEDYSFINDLPQLEVLDLRYNPIKDYSFLGNTQNLYRLILGNHKTKDYSFLQKIKQLSHLDLSVNEIKDISFLKDLPNLTYLNLEQNEIENIDWLGSLKNLKELDLGRNKISDISVFEHLPKIQKLNLWDNRLKDFSHLKYLTELKTLNLWDNHIEDISFLKDSPQLEDIDLRVNKIKDFTPLLSLTNLTKLNLGYTDLVDASFLKNFTKLTRLVLVYNKIVDVSFLKFLPHLNHLSLDSNKITNFPSNIFDYLKDLQILFLSGNPIKNIPKKIYDKSSENCCFNLYNYFKDLKKGSHINDTLKVVFVGNGRAGKTSLMRVLQGEEFDEAQKTTHAVYLKAWKADPDILFNIWDFGGQHLFHETHRLFLKTEAVTVLVWDIENNNQHEAFGINPETNEKHVFINYDQVYWLSYIKQLNPKSPIFLVQSKIEKEGNEKEIPPQYQEWKKVFNLLDSFHIDSKTGRGINYLKEELVGFAKKTIKEQPLIPQSWHSVRHMIHQLQQLNNKNKEQGDNSGLKQLGLEVFFAFCNHYDLDNDSKLTLLDYLHETGVFFYDAKLFNGQIILDQEWLIDAVYTLFDRNSIFYKIVSKGDGRFSLNELNEKWMDYTLEEKQYFIQYMQQCGICFESESGQGDFDKKIWVAPSLMSETAPPPVLRIFKDNKDSIFLQLEYTWFYYGIIQSFIISARSLSKVNQMWRYGIWLEGQEVDALIVANEKNKTIRIEVKGKKRKLWLDTIRNEFKNNHHTSSKITVSTDGKTFIPLTELEKYKDETNFTYDGKRFFVEDFKDLLNVNSNLSFSKLYNLDIEGISQKQKMEVLMTLDELKVKVRALIGNDKAIEAVNIVSQWADENNQESLKKNIALLNSEISTLKIKQHFDNVSFSKALRQKAKVNKSILTLLDFIVDDKVITTINVEKIEVKGDMLRRNKPLSIFISYSKKDRELKDELITHLSPLRRRNIVSNWDDRHIIGGELWDDTIKAKLKEADIILFLVSANFINTDYIWNHEIPLAEEQRKNGKARVIPIILKPCQWTKLDFAKQQALPAKGVAVSTFSDRDTAWLEVVESIEKVINDVQKPL